MMLFICHVENSHFDGQNTKKVVPAQYPSLKSGAIRTESLTQYPIGRSARPSLDSSKRNWTIDQIRREERKSNNHA